MDDLSKLPPTVWALMLGAAALLFLLWWIWRWYSFYRARRALRAAVTGGAADHLANALVPDGMGGGFHVDFLLLTMRSRAASSSRGGASSPRACRSGR